MCHCAPVFKSTTSLQGFSATEPASDQGAPQKCSLPENDAGYAPNPNRAVESSNTYSPSATTSNFEIGSNQLTYWSATAGVEQLMKLRGVVPPRTRSTRILGSVIRQIAGQLCPRQSVLVVRDGGTE